MHIIFEKQFVSCSCRWCWLFIVIHIRLNVFSIHLLGIPRRSTNNSSYVNFWLLIFSSLFRYLYVWNKDVTYQCCNYFWSIDDPCWSPRCVLRSFAIRSTLYSLLFTRSIDLILYSSLYPIYIYYWSFYPVFIQIIFIIDPFTQYLFHPEVHCDGPTAAYYSQ